MARVAAVATLLGAAVMHGGDAVQSGGGIISLTLCSDANCTLASGDEYRDGDCGDVSGGAATPVYGRFDCDKTHTPHNLKIQACGGDEKCALSVCEKTTVLKGGGVVQPNPLPSQEGKWKFVKVRCS